MPLACTRRNLQIALQWVPWIWHDPVQATRSALQCQRMCIPKYTAKRYDGFNMFLLLCDLLHTAIHDSNCIHARCSACRPAFEFYVEWIQSWKCIQCTLIVQVLISTPMLSHLLHLQSQMCKETRILWNSSCALFWNKYRRQKCIM